MKNLVGRKEPLSHSETEAVTDQIKTICKETVNDLDLKPLLEGKIGKTHTVIFIH